MEKKIGLFSVILLIAIFLVACGPSQAEINAQSTEAAVNTSGTMTAQAPTQTPTPTISPTPTLGIGSTKSSDVDGMEMVFVPEGSFLMGSSEGTRGAMPPEFPQHEVFLNSFWVDRTEVTNAMFAAFLNAQGNQVEDGKSWLDTDREKDYVSIEQVDGLWQPKEGKENHPVVMVNWYGAAAYCEWTGRRLPTEAEWEKAARGENGQIFPWGDEFDSSVANLDDMPDKDDWKIECTESGCDGFAHTSPVGIFFEGASPYGALDMAGNVWEWVADWEDWGYYANSPLSNPRGPSSGNAKWIRGGSWDSGDYRGRAATRFPSSHPKYSRRDLGFRCVLDVSP
jgi:formylglycine-generating enzyme required for sulfatase activity